MQLFLVRHGQDLDNSRSLVNGRRDTGLTESGRKQALILAQSLRSKEIDLIYSSPLQRARETAAIISQELAIAEVHVEDGLIEREYGILTGRPTSEIESLARSVSLSHGFRYVIDSEGIEDYLSLWTRAGRVLAGIRSRHPSETVLIVAHNEIIKMIRANFEEKPWQEEIQRPPLSNCEVIHLAS
jgi:broad specificity phosphatase PhoE